MNTKDKLFTAIGSAAIITSVGIGVVALSKNYNLKTDTQSEIVDSSMSQDSDVTESDNIDDSVVLEDNEYTDGDYIASVNYDVPRGYTNSISVTISVLDGIIESVETNNTYNDNESGWYIDSFESAIESEVVGKSINDVSYSRIGGASYTTDSFVSALETIKDEASS